MERCALVPALSVILLALAGSGAPLRAQADRVAVTVDYVGADGAYLPIGADDGVGSGDTITVFADAVIEESLGALVLTSVTRRRSVARPIGPGFAPARGDVVYWVPRPTAPAIEAPTDAPSPAADRARRADPTPSAAGAEGGSAGPRISGRIGLELDARETRTSWSGDLFGETRRRFATPTTRFSLVGSELPGGIEVRTNLRAAYRYDELALGPPPTSVRVYEAAASKTFEVVPVELTVGRFSNPYESYSAYWDGLLVRIGRRRGLGVGAAAGFEPGRRNEGFSSAVPKLTGFADFAARGDLWRYDTDVSFHALRPRGGGDSYRYVGWTQRIAIGPVDVSQRLQVDEGTEGGRWSLRDLRVRGSVRVGGTLRLRGAYGRSRPGMYVLTDPLAEGVFQLGGLSRDEVSAGFGLSGARGSLFVDAGRTRRVGADAGLSLSGQGALRLGGARLLFSGRHWRRDELQSLALSPGVAFGVGPVDGALGYRLYRTVSGFGTIDTHAVDARLSTTLAEVYRVTARAEQQWGVNLSGTRLQLAIWRSF